MTVRSRFAIIERVIYAEILSYRPHHHFVRKTNHV